MLKIGQRTSFQCPTHEMIGQLLFLPVKGARPVGVIEYLYCSGLCGQEVVGVVGVETTFQGVKAAGREHCMGSPSSNGASFVRGDNTE